LDFGPLNIVLSLGFGAWILEFPARAGRIAIADTRGIMRQPAISARGQRIPE
jgi:hypothetical protein